MRVAWGTLVCCMMLAGFAPSASRADPLDERFSDTEWMTRFVTERTSRVFVSPEIDGEQPSRATAMGWAPDGSNRLFVTMQDGTVGVVLKGGAPSDRLAVVFAAIDPIHFALECGLLGLAFDPDFQRNHYVYFFVTVSDHEQQIIRYTDDDSVGKDKTVIVAGLPTAGARHNGGALGIGPDNKLYWGIGDQANGVGVDADLSSLSAKIGRANLDGSVPGDNPFFDGDGPNADYIWARGMRNPFTLTFQPDTGALWVNVVGEKYEQTFIVRSGDHAGYIAYENNQPDGYITPVIAYKTLAAGSYDEHALVDGGASRVSNVATFTTVDAHGFRRGQTVGVFVDPNFRGRVVVASTPTPTAFTAIQIGPDASASGSVGALTLGRCITGGTFYAGTAFPPEYRGNFFFGDWSSGYIVRAVLSAPATVDQVDFWREAKGPPIDIETGPDGALYYLVDTGKVFRIAFDPLAQGIVVSKSHIWMSEGGRQSVQVSLAADPGAERVVNVARASGSSTIGVSTGELLSFNSTNWNVPQAISFESSVDPAATATTAVFELTSSGIAAESVTVHATEDPRAAVVVSPDMLHIDEGSHGTLEVALATPPDHATSVEVAITGDGDLAISDGARLTFTQQDFATAQSVVIDSAQDPDPDFDSAAISIAIDGKIVRSVSVFTNDDEGVAPAFTSEPVTSFSDETVYSYSPTTTGTPGASLLLLDSNSALTMSEGVIVTLAGPRPGARSITLVASNGVPPIAIQRFDLVPTVLGCILLAPYQHAVVSGTEVAFTAEVVHEDETGSAISFFVDGESIGALSGLAGVADGGLSIPWDTTAYANGPHRLKVRAAKADVDWTCEAVIDVVVDNAPDPDAGLAMDAGLMAEDAGLPDAALRDEDGGEHAHASTTDGGRSDASDAGEHPGPMQMRPADAGADARDAGIRRRDGGTTGSHRGAVTTAKTHREAVLGCGCRAAPARTPRAGIAFIVLSTLLVARRRRRFRI